MDNYTTPQIPWQAHECSPRGFVKHQRWWESHPTVRSLTHLQHRVYTLFMVSCRGIGQLTGCMAGEHNEPLTLRDISIEMGLPWASFHGAVKHLRKVGLIETRTLKNREYIAFAPIKPEVVKHGRRLVHIGMDVGDELERTFTAQRRDDPAEQFSRRSRALTAGNLSDTRGR